MKKILVIGGAGYLGGAIVKHFLRETNNNYSITVLDNLLYEEEYLQPVDFIYEDVRNKNSIKKIINNYDAIILLAAIVGDAACQANPLMTMEINEDFPIWLRKNFSGKIIFASTCSVYGNNKNLMDENDDINPLSLYAKTKANVEFNYLKRKNTIIFRLGTLFGVSIRPRFDLLINTLTARAIIDKHIRIFGGNQWRPNLHVLDAGKCFLDAALKNYESGLYNLASFNLRIIDIGDSIYRKFPDIHYEITDSKYEDSRNYRVSCEKVKEKINFQAKLNLDDGIREVENLVKSGRIKKVFYHKYHNAQMTKLINNIK